MKSVYVKAWLKSKNGDVDISDTIEYFRYESDIDKGELVEFRIKSDKSLDLANHKELVAGGVIIYQYGFIRNAQSSPRLCRIGNVEVDFSDKRVQLKITASDKGIELKKGSRYKVWTNITLSDIAKAIALDYGLDFIGEPTTKVYTAMPQAGRSDWEFLNFLVLREHGIFRIDVSDTVLTLEQNSRSKKAVKEYVMGDNIINFRVQFKEVTAKPSLSTSTNHGIDDKTGKPTFQQKQFENQVFNNLGFQYSFKDNALYKVEIARGKREYETKDGAFSVDQIDRVQYKNNNRIIVSSEKVTTRVNKVEQYDANGNKIIEQVTYTPVDPNEGRTLNNNINEKNKQKVLTANLLVELEPLRKAGDVITINVPVDRYSGIWYAEKVVHTIDSKGGFTEYDLNKNGTSKPTKSSATKNNSKVNKGDVSTRENTRIYRGADGVEKDGPLTTIANPTLTDNNFTVKN